MRQLARAILVIASFGCTSVLIAQHEVCRSYVADSPEDELVREVTGAEGPEEQIAALDKYTQAHPDSKFMPCVDAFYTSAYFKLNNYDKVIEFGEKAFGLNNRDLPLLDSIVYAYVASAKVSDAAFDVIFKAADQIKLETTPARSPGTSDADWEKAQQDAAAQAGEWRDRMSRGFFQLLPRVTDARKMLQLLDEFSKAYPEAANAAQPHLFYFLAYKATNDHLKASEYAEKAVKADPNNIEALNAVADYYATRQTNLDTAAAYAKQVVDLGPSVKKPEGAPDEQFKAYLDNQVGLAHLTLGYVSFQKASKTRKVGPAIQEFKLAIDLLNANPELQGKALYFLGSAYEFQVPPNHRAAIDSLTRAANLQCSFQGEARNLLAKVKAAAGATP